MLALLALACLAQEGKPAQKEAPPPPNRIVLHNEHNGPEGNSGTAEANVYLMAKSGNVLWRAKNVKVEWSKTEDKATIIPYKVSPNTKIARIKVEVTKWHHRCGGLAEIQVFRNDELISEDSFATASSENMKNDLRTPMTLTDGNTSSARELHGYCILANDVPGWFEVDMTRSRSGKSKSQKKTEPVKP